MKFLTSAQETTARHPMCKLICPCGWPREPKWLSSPNLQPWDEVAPLRRRPAARVNGTRPLPVTQANKLKLTHIYSAQSIADSCSNESSEKERRPNKAHSEKTQAQTDANKITQLCSNTSSAGFVVHSHWVHLTHCTSRLRDTVPVDLCTDATRSIHKSGNACNSVSNASYTSTSVCTHNGYWTWGGLSEFGIPFNGVLYP